MKNLFVMASLCGILFTSCKFDSMTMLGNKRIEPSNNIVNKEFAFDNFDRVELDVVAGVQFVQTADKNCRAVLTAPDNYLDLYQLEVSDGKLNVELSRGHIDIVADKTSITIFAPMLHELISSGVANVKINKLNSKRLKVENSGVGTMTLNDIRVGELMAECKGVGNIELSGQSYRTEMTCSGVGHIKAEKLKANIVVGEVSGVGGISCYAVDSIIASVSGVGSLKYEGSPQHKKIVRTGIGKITGAKNE